MVFAVQDPQAVADDSDRLYRRIADTIPHMVWCARGDGELDFFNRRCYEYTGLDQNRLEGWGWKEVIHPEDWERCLATWSRSLQTGERYEIEYRLRRADGEYRWHHGAAVPVRDRAGQIERWFGTCTDVDEQIRSAQLLEAVVRERTRALQASEERFRHLTHLSADYYWETDAEDRFTEIVVGSRTPRTIPPERLIGKTRWEVPYISPGPEGWQQLREDIAQRRPFYDFLLSVAASDGTRRWYSISGEPVYDAEGAFRGYRGVGTHLTERKEAEDALRASEERFRLFMKYSPAAAWMKDSRLRFIYVNPAYEAAFQKNPAQVIGKTAEEIWPEQATRAWREEDDKVLNDRQVLQAIRTLPLPDGRPRQWLAVKFPLPDANGATALAGVALDITERNEAEALLRRHAEDVRQLLSRLVTAQEHERRRVADNLHDLIGQNLSALGIELAALNSRLSPESRSAVTPRVEAIAGLLDATIDAIRGVMTELRPVALEEFGLAAALRWYASVFAQRTGMKVSTDAPELKRRLPADTELALFRIAQEALTNAAKHSGGAHARITLVHVDARLRLTVEDDGSGFADSQGARSARRGGWGLSAMRERAEAHGGFLRVEFPERGSRIVVEMPLEDKN